MDVDVTDDMTTDQYQSQKETFLQSLKDTNVLDIERNTRDQSLSTIWFRERKIRVTASSFDKICKMKSTTSTAKVTENLLYAILSGNKYTRHGTNHEEIAIHCYEEKYNLKTIRCGLMICEDKPYLACSPDRFVPSCNAIVEVETNQRGEMLIVTIS